MDKKMTILQVHNFYQIPGGEDTVVENERRLLEEQGHRVVRYFRDNKELLFSQAAVAPDHRF